jgi:hypothetical protein
MVVVAAAVGGEVMAVAAVAAMAGSGGRGGGGRGGIGGSGSVGGMDGGGGSNDHPVRPSWVVSTRPAPDDMGKRLFGG